jgi:hypothetical protein
MAIKDLEKKLAKYREDITHMEQMHKLNNERVDRVKVCILKISEAVECDKEQLEDLIGNQGITESNMLIYMGLVEQRINEILQAFVYI